MKLNWSKISDSEKFLAAMQIIHGCQKCGRCCVKMSGIAFNSADVLRMAKQLGVERTEFLKNYTTASPRKSSDRWLNTKGDRECVFWSETGCTQYAGRGQVCRLYPFTSPEQLDKVRNKKPWWLYDKCKGMFVTYEKVLKESFNMPLNTAESITKSDIGNYCMLHLVADMYTDEAAIYAAREIGLEYIPDMDRLYHMAWSYAVAFTALRPREVREHNLREIISRLEKF